MRVRAFAKINLSLRVLGVRADGYHELRTIFQSIALHDTLTIRRTRGPFTLTCDDPACPADRTNLVWRAAARVWRASSRRGGLRGFSVHVAKRIPVQAGLGGGSSDAAAAIRAFGALLGVSREQQHAIGRALGADIPYFFEGGTALGLDRGDLLFPLVDRPASSVALIVPAFGVSTKDAFGWLDREARSAKAVALQRKGDRASDGARRLQPGVSLSNDLQAVVARHHPEIAGLVRQLRACGAAHAAMSGSGSAVFGLFPEKNRAEDAAAACVGRGRRAIVTSTVNRETYRRLAAK